MSKNVSNIKICCIFNVAPHYNASIYKLMDKELDCHFYFGDRIHMPIKLMNYESLEGFKGRLKYILLFSSFYWQKGAVSKFFKPYNDYILIGEPFCLSNWVLLLLSLFSNKKIYLWTHGWYGNESFFKSLIKKIFYGLSNHLFLYGDYAKRLMINEGFNPNKLTCIYNSMDYEKQLAIRNNLKKSNVYINTFKNTNPVIIYVGRIQKSKRLDILIDTVEQLNQESFFVNTVIVGQDVENTGIELLIKERGLENHIWLYGPCFDEDVLGDLFYNADVCVTPGSVGLTAIHSLMYGTPVITHDDFSNQGPEFEVIIEGTTGFFFKKDNVCDLKVKIKGLLNRNQKYPMYRKEGYRMIDERYNPHYQIQVFKDFFGIN